MLALLACVAHGADIDVLLSEPTAVYGEAAASLKAELPGHNFQVFDVRDAPAAGQTSRIVVAFGQRALQRALAERETSTIVAGLITARTHESMAAALRGRRATVVILDQPYARQIDLVRAALPGSKRIGIVHSPEGESALAGLSSAAREAGLSVVSESVSGSTELHAALTRLLPRCDLLLAIPDNLVYNQATLPNILLTAYRAGKPLIGFSPFYVRGGALAAVYSSPQQIGRQVAEAVNRALAGGSLPATQSARYFSVGVNPTVARSLGLSLDSESDLAGKLEQMGGDQ
ncbi:MAG: hypothetical protein JNJ60_04670 [Rhodocyclaceae bacterium]|nr:hypothetical protein [Rhodocyclaceae bacterium]